MKYRLLAWLDKVTGHHIWQVCRWVHGYELVQMAIEEAKKITDPIILEFGNFPDVGSSLSEADIKEIARRMSNAK